MQLELLRYFSNYDCTLGLLFVDKKFFCYTLEDPKKKDKKVQGKTRIPHSFYPYKVGLQNVVTPLTRKYRNRFKWFDKHIHVKDVYNFTNIYFHIGNWSTDTEGCILLGDKPTIDSSGTGMIYNSTNTFKKFYELVYSKAAKEDLELSITDVDDPESFGYIFHTYSII